MGDYYGWTRECERPELSRFESGQGMRTSFSEEGNEDLHSQCEKNSTDDSDKLCFSDEDLDSCVDSISVDDSWFQTNKNAPDSAPVISFVDTWEVWLNQSANSKEDCVPFEWFLNDNTGNYNNTMVYSLKHCDSCETYFTKKYDFLQHLKLCRVYPVCKFCKRSFSNRAELQRHITVSQHQVVTREDWRRVSQAEYIRLCREGRVYTSEYISVKQHLSKRENKQNWQGKGKAILKSQNNSSLKHPVGAASKFSCSGTDESGKKGSNSSSVDWERAPTEGLFCNTSKTYDSQAHILPFPDALEEEFKKSSQEKFVTEDLNRVDTKNLQTDECNNNGPNKTEKENMATQNHHTLFFCQMCNTYFIYLKTFKKHRGKCSGKNICKVCFQNFKNFKLLLNHIRKEKHAVQLGTTHISANQKTFQRLLNANRIAPGDVLEYQEKSKENLTKQISETKEVEGTLSTTPVTEACEEQTSVAGNMPKEMIASGKCEGTIIHEKDNSSKEKSKIIGKECASKDSSVNLPGEEQIIKTIAVEKETCNALEDNQKLVDKVGISKGEFPVTPSESVIDHIKQMPVSPSDSGCQMDDICHDIDSPFIGLDIKEELLEESVNTTTFRAVDERDMLETVNDNTLNRVRETCSTLTGEKLKQKESYKPLPKSVKIARLEHKTSSLSEYLEVQKHPERQVRCIKLRRRTEYCPGCMESVDATSAILNTETFEVSMWCKTCAWSILFTDFFHPQ
ncbi:uncharacterized protein LOC134764668 isoform X2 [Penaeus indicus]